MTFFYFIILTWIGISLVMANAAVQGWKIVCISDTHSLLPSKEIPNGDVLIHAGDFSNVGHQKDYQAFHEFLDQLPHKHKIFIAGNHDITMQKAYYTSSALPRQFHRQLFSRPDFNPTEYADQCIATIKQPSSKGDNSLIYLEDEQCELSPSDPDAPSLRVYGSPWQPEFCDWAFNLPIGPELAAKWKAIPDEIDILITHGPPKGILDMAENGFLCGCPYLKQEVLSRVKPRIHVFGHIHEAYGK
jgi:3',5'-cyclic AMP phosphodiesterase CpdA